MIETDKRKAIFLLHQEGMTLREIAQRLELSRNTVRVVVQQKGVMPQSMRKDKCTINTELLAQLYQKCDGRIQRIYEKLTEDEHIEVTYSTLTRMLRKLGISGSQKTRCERVPDEPGAEMQHDTTVYQVKLASGAAIRVVASLMYLRYSKRRYLKFYRAFNRFKMKCFFHEALTFWGYAAGLCIIDNTNLARLRGTGKNALIVPEMEAFSKQYGFQFICHEVKHPNRKAGEERSFWTVETNFLPGRAFESIEDMNRQAFEWSTVRLENKPQGKARLIPAQAFEHECAYLMKLAAYLPAPYRMHNRGVDQYGYAAFGGNFYWVPGSDRAAVTLFEYSDRLKIYRLRACLIEYLLPAEDVKNKQICPDGLPVPPQNPRHRTQPAVEEERQLRAMAAPVGAYLDFILQLKGIQRHEFLRKLLALSRKMTPALFIKSLERACKYRITSLQTVERIAGLCLSEGSAELVPVEIDAAFMDRETYQEGALTDQPDLSVYEDSGQDIVEHNDE